MRRSDLIRFRVSVGSALKARRLALGLSMKGASGLIAASPATIHNIENGKFSYHFDTAVAYSKALGEEAVRELASAILSFGGL